MLHDRLIGPFELLLQVQHLKLDLFHQLFGVIPFGAFRLDQDPPFDICDPDTKELVEVVGEDAEKAQPLDQRDFGVHRFLQDAGVEAQPAEFFGDGV